MGNRLQGNTSKRNGTKSAHHSDDKLVSSLRDKIAALDSIQAVVEFDLNGNVLTANQNFLNIFGYELDEIKGKHHQMFCDPKCVDSPEYRAFWDKLKRG